MEYYDVLIQCDINVLIFWLESHLCTDFTEYFYDWKIF